MTRRLAIDATMAMTTQILGALPTFAFSVAPAVASLAISRSMPVALAIGAAIGAMGGFLGYIAAFFYHLPVGASQAGCTVALMLTVFACSGIWRRLGVPRRVRPAEG